MSVIASKRGITAGSIKNRNQWFENSRRYLFAKGNLKQQPGTQFAKGNLKQQPGTQFAIGNLKQQPGTQFAIGERSDR